MRWWLYIASLLTWLPLIAHAGRVEIVYAVFIQQGETWQVSTTLRHADTGWEHYADGWRVVDEAGNILGTRELLHPHQNEQPFTRTLSDIAIPSEAEIIYVEAHDKVHGWSPQRLRVVIQQAQGDRFEVRKE